MEIFPFIKDLQKGLKLLNQQKYFEKKGSLKFGEIEHNTE
jgi:hypothetical protein